MAFSELTKQDVNALFSELDFYLHNRNQTMTVTLLGGVAALIQGYIDRATRDIDIAPIQDAQAFRSLCHERGVEVDIVTVVSLVSYDEEDTKLIFNGTGLKVRTLDHSNLIKAKLDRFIEQDRSDIIAIIEKTRIGYSEFKSLIQSSLPDVVVGPEARFILSAATIVEDCYGTEIEDFKNTFSKRVPSGLLDE